MSRLLSILGSLLLVIVAIAAILVIVLLRHGVSARDEPTNMEAAIARSLRHFAVPAALRNRRNPIPVTPAVLAEARAHFADHCAGCHGNDGRGRTEMGKGLYPRAPDMTLPATQNLSDGELYAIIRNGVRLTGMPAWGAEHADDADDWKLVHLVRHFPQISKEEIEEMRALNPISPAEAREQREEDEFLSGTSGGQTTHH